MKTQTKTQTKFGIVATMLALSSMLLMTSCINDEANKPVLTTNEVTEITSTQALCGGVITSDGGFAITARGVCWDTTPDPTIDDNKSTDGDGTGSFTSALTGLNFETTYYVRAYATNSIGTGYGATVSFITFGRIAFNPDITYGTMTDIDGNTCKTLIIGTQTWMAENLRVTKYNDGASISNVTDSTAWSELTTGAYCNYNNSTYNDTIETYGRLYNWYAVNTGKLCPVGWHVPTSAEWTTLMDSLGGDNVAGGKLKEAGTMHWKSPNIGATNESGFTALPAGVRELWGSFSNIGSFGVWWSVVEDNSKFALISGVGHNFSYADSKGYARKELGLSVRCLKD